MSISLADEYEARTKIKDIENNAVIKELDARIESVYKAVQNASYWKELTAPGTSDERMRAILKNVFLSVYWYQPHTTEAGYLMLGRLPKEDLRILKLLLLHKTEEAEHGLWALNDYLALGGDIKTAKSSPPDPATFAVAAVWWRLAQVEEPWAYLGAEYLFEYLTVKVAQPMVEMFKARGMKGDGLHFIVEHATEDVKHAILIRTIIVEVIEKYPEKKHAILRGFDYFNQVYPLPVWDAAYRRSL